MKALRASCLVLLAVVSLSAQDSPRSKFLYKKLPTPRV